MRAIKKIFCLLLTVILTVCAVPVIANAETDYRTVEISNAVGSVISVSSDHSEPSVSHKSGMKNYYVCEAVKTGGYHYSKDIVMTKPGYCEFTVFRTTYTETEHEAVTYKVTTVYPDDLNGKYFLKSVNVNQSYSIKSIVENADPSLKIEKYSEPRITCGFDRAVITNNGTSSSPDYSVKFTKEGFVRTEISYKLKDKNEYGSTYILFKAGNAMSAVVFWAESDGSSGDVTNMPSPNFYNSSIGLIKLPDTVPQRAGYVFAGWTDKGAHSAKRYVQYQPGKTYFFDSSETSTRLYPVWKSNELSFDSMGGDGGPDIIADPVDGKYKIPNETPTKAGFVFSCWVDSTNGKTRTITARPGDVITLKKDTTLYALYDEIPESIYIFAPPAKTAYSIGESLDLTGLSVAARYSGNKTVELKTSELTITGFSSSTAGTKTVTVDYLGKKATFTVTVKDGSGSGQDIPGGEAPVYSIKTLGTKGGVKYNQAVTLNVNLASLPSGCRVTIDGEDVTIINNTLVYKSLGRLTADKTFTLKVLYGNQEIDSETGTITVPHGFFDKLIAFFAKLFQGDKYAATVTF